MYKSCKPGRILGCLLATLAGLLPACQWDGHFTMLGYTTRPNYDDGIRTVHVPIFRNETFYRGLEFDLTRAVIREIESKTPYKVAAVPEKADSELLGKIVRVTKTVINANQNNEVREGQTILAVELIWRDMRPGFEGQVLSAQRQGGVGGPGGPVDPTAPPPPPVLVTALGTYVPEIGGSLTSSEKENVDRLAVQIVSMMEKPW